MVRRAEWQRSCEEHAKAEQERRAEWDQSVAEYTEAEHQRRAEWERKREEHAEQQQRHKREWETALSQHENDERRRQDEWNVRLQELCARLTTLGGRINALINEHPDIELLGARVDVLRDVESVQARAGVSTQSG
jgi:transketolase